MVLGVLLYCTQRLIESFGDMSKALFLGELLYCCIVDSDHTLVGMIYSLRFL